MRHLIARGLAVAAVLTAPVAHAAELDKNLAPLAPLVGKTWRGELSPPGAAKPIVDVSRFELALGGRAVRSLHSINDGETGGFYTTGTLEPGAEAGVLRFHELVKGTAAGPREVKSTSRILPDGRLHVKSQHLKNGQWVDGHEVRYVEDPKAVVRFKD